MAKSSSRGVWLILSRLSEANGLGASNPYWVLLIALREVGIYATLATSCRSRTGYLNVAPQSVGIDFDLQCATALVVESFTVQPVSNACNLQKYCAVRGRSLSRTITELWVGQGAGWARRHW